MFFFENGMLIFEFRFDEANFYISHFLMSRWYYKRQACYGIIAITIQYVYYQTNGSVLYVLLHSIVAVAQSAMHNGTMSLMKEHLKIFMLSEFEWLAIFFLILWKWEYSNINILEFLHFGVEAWFFLTDQWLWLRTYRIVASSNKRY